MSIKPIFQPIKTMPMSLFATSNGGPNVIIRDQFTLATWLVMGASANALISILLPKSAKYLAGCLFAFLVYSVSSTALQIYGIIPNPEMVKVIPGKTTAQIPDMNGSMPTEPGKEGIVILLLGFKSNHPLRMLAPGFKETGDHFFAMLKSLDNPEGRQQFGFLGISSYIGNSSQASNEVMTISYWRNIEGLHAFAESPAHRAGWNWWNRTAKEHPHLVIYHEIFKAEGKSHENVYLNAQPMLLGGTSFAVRSKDKEEENWVSPLVDANRGVLATSRGRLGLRSGRE